MVLGVQERRMAWKEIWDNFPGGVVLFEPLSDRTTEITVKLRSSIEPATLAKVTRDYLTNFKRFVEAAAIISSDPPRRVSHLVCPADNTHIGGDGFLTRLATRFAAT